MAAKIHRRRAGSARSEERGATGGFTLVELLVSTAIMLVVILVLLQVIAGMTNIWHNTSGEISSFQSARAAFSTLTRTLSRATLKSYTDYVTATGASVTETNINSAGYVPVSSFARSSDLYFTCGPCCNAAWTVSAAKVNIYPGDAVFFAAPLGIASTSAYRYLPRTLNAVGFYVAYNQLTTGASGSLPTWLSAALGFTSSTKTPYRFRLMEYLEYTDQTYLYWATAPNGIGAGTYANGVSAVANGAITGNTQAYGTVGTAAENIVLGENIVLLIIRPRLEKSDEQIVAGSLPTKVTYNAATANSIISPNYAYDSRAWWGGYTTGGSGNVLGPAYAFGTPSYAAYMRNQLPPILDVAMVAVDPNSIVRYGTTSTNPPAALEVSSSLFGLNGAAFNASTAPPSANMDTDLATFGTALAAKGIHYRIFRTSIQMEGAAWVNE